MIVEAIVVGLAAGTHISTWGMYKDCIHEGFTVRKYSRSIVLGAVIGAALFRFNTGQGFGRLLVLFGVIYALERACTEFYKTFVREEDQSKYFIPMQAHVGGRLVRDRRTRLLIGVLHILLAVLLAGLGFALDRSATMNRAVVVLIIGSMGGWFSAMGGALKDAPFEGFQLLKFFRSPLLAAAWGLLLSQHTDNYLLIGLGALGYTIATLETWKTFFFPSKPRGKFAGKPILYPHLVARRNWLVPVFAGIWLLVLAGFALSQPTLALTDQATTNGPVVRLP